MSDESGWRFYGAVVASTISAIAWIGVPLIGAYAVYAVATDGPAIESALAAVAAIVVGMAFAKIEKRLYRVDE